MFALQNVRMVRYVGAHAWRCRSYGPFSVCMKSVLSHCSLHDQLTYSGLNEAFQYLCTNSSITGRHTYSQIRYHGTNTSRMSVFMIFLPAVLLFALLARKRTCDSQVAGSSPGWAPLRSGLGGKLLTPVRFCHQAV